MDLGRLDSALSMFDQALNIYKKRDDLQEILILHYNVGAGHQRQNHFEQSIKNNLEGIKHAEAIKDTGLIARGNYLTGIIFCDQKNFWRARKYLFTAHELYKELRDPVSEADNLEAIGYSYILEQKYDEARGILSQGLKLYEKAGNELGKAKMYTQLSACYENNPSARLNYLEKSQEILTKIAPDHQ